MEKERCLTIVMRAARMVFRDFVKDNLYIDGPYFGESLLLRSGILSFVRITGAVKGRIIVYSNKDTATHIAHKFAVNNFEGTPGEIESGIGELCNLVSGTAKRICTQQNILFEFSQPEIYNIRDMNGNFNALMNHNNHIVVYFDPYTVYIDVFLDPH